MRGLKFAEEGKKVLLRVFQERAVRAWKKEEIKPTMPEGKKELL